MKVDVSIGEVVDKITILQIKSERFTDKQKIDNVNVELSLLLPLLQGYNLDSYIKRLQEVNETIWEIEDDIRMCESIGNFGSEFIGLARKVYTTNDVRAAIKREVNIEFKSEIIEEKGYQKY